MSERPWQHAWFLIWNYPFCIHSFYLGSRSPGLDELPACVHNMLHLQVHGCGHHSHDIPFPQVEPRCVHEVQEDAEPLGADVRIQIDDTQVAFQLVSEDTVEQATVKQAELPARWSQRVSVCALSSRSPESKALWHFIITSTCRKPGRCQQFLKDFVSLH